MNQIIFPKPTPAEPLPLQEWLKLTDRAEVGREPFFRGRDNEYRVFRDALSSLDEGHIGGGSMIFQGAPGAGKTALMQECMEAVRQHSTPDNPWVAVNIKPQNLESATEVVMLLVDAANAESNRLSEVSSGSSIKKINSIIEIGRKMYHDLSQRGIGIAGISVGGKLRNDQDAKIYSQRVFRDAASLLKSFHIVVVVDEAQNIPIEKTTKGVVDCLHNPPSEIPLIAAFFGLSDTEEVLSKCGVSRPADERVVTLELLSHKESSEVMMSIFESYKFIGSQEDIETWVKCLAELSQGWPQHISRVSVVAARVISSNDKRIKAKLLKQVLAEGQKRKDNYYAMILRRCSGQLWIYKKLAMIASEKNDILSLDDILYLAKFARNKKAEPIKDFLTEALHAGILIETRNPPNYYRIPIPSLCDYLLTLSEDPPAGI
ncbi:MAG: ATP-binding protein [Gammaproteobacteria bacterium]|nr:ATP-binding protein [Gammaproteobacteria bacterium]